MDLAPLLAPVSADAPGGADLSFSPAVDAIQEMRREDDPTLDQGAWVTALKAADWPGVARACEALLRERSKDLRVAGWLADAWARLRGFDGLADGLALAAGLVEQHWDHLHPLPEDGDPEPRIGNLRWLAARTERLAATLPLVAHGGQRRSLADIAGARSRRLAGAADGSPAAGPEDGAADAAPSLDAVWREVAAAGPEAARARRAAVGRACEALAALDRALDARLGGAAPSLAGARDALQRTMDEVARLERDCRLVPHADAGTGAGAATQAEAAPHGPAEAAAHAAHAAHAGPAAPPARGAGADAAPGAPERIASRAQALEQLRQVAAFFRATEPHSPVAYLADKAVRWSGMPLHLWLREVVKDHGSLEHLQELLGAPPPDAS